VPSVRVYLGFNISLTDLEAESEFVYGLLGSDNGMLISHTPDLHE
jgi:hypothetical protein